MANNYSIQGSTLCGELQNLIDLACTLERSYGFAARGWPLLCQSLGLSKFRLWCNFFLPFVTSFKVYWEIIFSCFNFHVLFRRLSELNWNVKFTSRAETERTMSSVCICSCSFIPLSCRYEHVGERWKKIVRRLVWMCALSSTALASCSTSTATCLFPVTSARDDADLLWEQINCFSILINESILTIKSSPLVEIRGGWGVHNL